LYIQCVIYVKIRLQSFNLRCFSTTIKLCLPSFFFFYFTQRKTLVSYRHFGTSCSVRNYDSTLRKIPKQRMSHFYVAVETYEVKKSSSFVFVLKSVANIRRRKANWIGHILHRNCLLQQVIEGKIKGGIEVTGRRGRRRRKLLDDLNLLTPNVNYSGRTAPLTSKVAFYIFIQQI